MSFTLNKDLEEILKNEASSMLKKGENLKIVNKEETDIKITLIKSNTKEALEHQKRVFDVIEVEDTAFLIAL